MKVYQAIKSDIAGPQWWGGMYSTIEGALAGMAIEKLESDERAEHFHHRYRDLEGEARGVEYDMFTVVCYRVDSGEEGQKAVYCIKGGEIIIDKVDVLE